MLYQLQAAAEMDIHEKSINRVAMLGASSERDFDGN
jgi:hypothetical protein